MRNIMAKVYPYLTLKNTKEALKYYEKALGVTNIIRMPVQSDQAEEFGISRDRVDEMTMHSQFEVLGTTIMAADDFQSIDLDYSGIFILIDLNSEDKKAMNEAEEFWSMLVERDMVTINMPFEKQFWGGAMGDFTDKYGIRWMIHAQPYSKLKK